MHSGRRTRRRAPLLVRLVIRRLPLGASPDVGRFIDDPGRNAPVTFAQRPGKFYIHREAVKTRLLLVSAKAFAAHGAQLADPLSAVVEHAAFASIGLPAVSRAPF